MPFWIEISEALQFRRVVNLPTQTDVLPWQYSVSALRMMIHVHGSTGMFPHV